jgi:hypothetical protein
MCINTTLNHFRVKKLNEGEDAMKNRVLFLLVVFCVVMAVMGSSIYAQEPEEEISNNRRVGSAAATELLIPVGARDMAMGGSGIAMTNGVEAIHWNPAGLARIPTSAEAMVSSMTYIADIRLNYATVGVSFGGFGVVGLSVRMLNFGDVPLTTNEDPEGRGGRTYSPNFMTVGLTYARRFTDAITVGGTFKAISEKIGRVNGSGFAVDLGVQYHGAGGIKGLNFGVALKNYGPQMSFGGSGLLRKAISEEGLRSMQYYSLQAASFELPSTLEIGASYVRDMTENIVLTVNSAFVNDNMALNAYRFGGEVGYKMEQMGIFGRGGFEYVPGSETDEFLFGPSVGCGLYYNTAAIDILLDFCWRQTEYFDDNMVFSFKFGF